MISQFIYTELSLKRRYFGLLLSYVLLVQLAFAQDLGTVLLVAHDFSLQVTLHVLVVLFQCHQLHLYFFDSFVARQLALEASTTLSQC